MTPSKMLLVRDFADKLDAGSRLRVFLHFGGERFDFSVEFSESATISLGVPDVDAVEGASKLRVFLHFADCVGNWSASDNFGPLKFFKNK